MSNIFSSGAPLVDPSVSALVMRMANLPCFRERDNSDLCPPGENIGDLWVESGKRSWRGICLISMGAFTTVGAVGAAAWWGF